MKLCFGLGWRRRSSGGGGIPSLSMTGLTSGEARPGDHASISVGFPSGVTSWTSQSWGVGTYGDSTYGTGASPTDYTASDTLVLRWEGQGDDGNTYRSSAPIRYALGSNPSIATQSWTVDDESGTIDGSASGANLTFSNYQIADVPSTVTINPSTGQITKSLPFATVGASGSDTSTVSCVDQYNRPYSGAFDWSYALRTQATAAGALADPSFTENTGDQTFATAGDITANGNTLTYSVNAVTGVTINPSTGVVTFDTNLMALQSSTAIVVTPTDEYLRTSPTGFGVSITEAAAAITINSVVVGSLTSGTLPFTVTTPVSQPPDNVSGVYFVIVPTGATAPSALQIRSGLDATNGSPLDSGNFTWTASPPNQTITSGIDEFVDVHVIIDNGALSNVAADTNFEIDTTTSVLTAITGTQTGETTANWSGTTDEAQGTIFAAARLASSPVLPIADIENGTGNAVAISQDNSPTADSSNGGSFTDLTASTEYRVDAFQRDEFTNETGVVTSAAFTTASAASGAFTNAPKEGELRFGEVNLTFDFSGVSSGDYLAATGALLGANGSDSLSRFDLPGEGTRFFAGDDGVSIVGTSGAECAGTTVFQCPASLAGNSSVVVTLRNTVIDNTTGVLAFANLGPLASSAHGSNTATDSAGTAIGLDVASSSGGKFAAAIASASGTAAAFTSSPTDVETLVATAGPGAGGSVAFAVDDTDPTTTVIQGTAAANAAGAAAAYL